jgi:hypothetical protein
MKNNLKVVSTPIKNDWLELVVLINNKIEFDAEKLKKLYDTFTEITVLSAIKRDENIPDYINWLTCDESLSRAEIWNQKVQTSQKQWLLFLELDDDLDLHAFPMCQKLNHNQWIPALFIQSTGLETSKQYYQIRMVPKSDKPIFCGKNIPDATKYIIENNIDLSSVPIKIKRDSPPMGNTNPEDELSVQHFSPQLYLQLGNSYYDKRKYAIAAAQYRRLLKMENILQYDRLAAINGLAGCCVETYKWERAVELTVESIEIEPAQYLPYLIQYRIYQLNKQWGKSLSVLEKYFDALKFCSKANYDKYISPEETLLKLGELAINSGSREKALCYYEKYYRLKNGRVDSSLLDMLLVLSIELSDYEKSIFFFKEMFDEYIPDKQTNKLQSKLNEYLSMFMVNGWYDYPFEVYNRLYEKDSGNSDYRRKLIVTLAKTNRIDLAKKLIANNL